MCYNFYVELTTETFSRYVGDNGLDERPYYFNDAGECNRLPVACDVSFADGRETVCEDADITAIDDIINGGYEVVIPIYHGCDVIGIKTIQKTLDGRFIGREVWD
jgi:hypothetical protein